MGFNFTPVVTYGVATRVTISGHGETIMKHQRILSSSVAVAALTFASAAAFGGIIAEDNFDYTLGTTVQGNGSAGGGWAGGWGRTTNAGAGNGGSNGEIVANLSFGSLVTSGNAAQFNALSSGSGSLYTRIHDRDFAGGASFNGSSGTFWNSYLYRLTSDGGRVNRFDIDDSTGNLEYRTQLNFANSDDVSSNQVGEQGDITDFTLVLDTTYMFLNKRVQGSSSKLWVLTASAFDSIAPGGITEAELDAQASHTSSTTSGDKNANGGGKFEILTQADGGQYSYQFDELRFGDTVADVTPNTIPEPAALALLGLGGAMLLSRRGRRD